MCVGVGSRTQAILGDYTKIRKWMNVIQLNIKNLNDCIALME